jgi:hypothetical protein
MHHQSGCFGKRKTLLHRRILLVDALSWIEATVSQWKCFLGSWKDEIIVEDSWDLKYNLSFRASNWTFFLYESVTRIITIPFFIEWLLICVKKWTVLRLKLIVYGLLE